MANLKPLPGDQVLPRWTLDNRWLSLPGDDDVQAGREPRQVDGAWAAVTPEPVPNPQLLGWSASLAESIGIDRLRVGDETIASMLAGNRLIAGAEPFATNYAGHQFGVFAGQLGDGRAITLGEWRRADGSRVELALKGAGRTPFSRHADGRAVLRSSLREFVASEAMHALGIPTTRALSLVTTGQPVMRDMFYDGNAAPEPGAIVCRVARSFVRPGHFELPAARGDVALLKQITELVIARDEPDIHDGHDDLPSRTLAFYGAVVARTAKLMAEWLRVGFVHGVMNTDNLSTAGLTIDYGPFGFVNQFDPAYTPNWTDRERRRYRLGAQPAVAHWNLARLAEALAPLTDPDALIERHAAFVSVFEASASAMWAAKLGLSEATEAAAALHQTWLTLLHDGALDYTLSHRALAECAVDGAATELPERARYDETAWEKIRPRFEAFLTELRHAWQAEGRAGHAVQTGMNAVNPLYTPRNHLLLRAIQAVEAGETSALDDLTRVLANPYQDQGPEAAAFAEREPDWAREAAGCGQLSCSS